MDTELLKTFLEVKSTRHFGKAAENLYLTQAAVSARIKQLENLLGGPLFTRLRNNLQLTHTGERLVEHAETILLAWERARQDVGLKQKQQHIFSIGATSGLWDILLREALGSIHSQFPELALRAEVLGPQHSIRSLMERTLDLALVYEPAKIRDIYSTPVTQTELVMVSSQQASDPNQALASGYIAVDWGLSFQLTFAQLFPEAPIPLLHTTLARIAIDFLSRFGGSAYLPFAMLEAELGTSMFLVEGAPVISRQIFACYHAENAHQKQIEDMLEIIRGQLPSIETSEQPIEL